MLHDIGIFRCNAPDIDCHGDAGYICHGYLGAELMRGRKVIPAMPACANGIREQVLRWQ